MAHLATILSCAGIALIFLTSAVHGASLSAKSRESLESEKLATEFETPRKFFDTDSRFLRLFNPDDDAHWEEVFQLVAPAYIQVFLDVIQRQPVPPEEIKNQLDSWNISNACVGHTMEWIYRMTNKTTLSKSLWALHMVDSWGKRPEGLLTGHINAMGDFDECVRLSATDLKFESPVNIGESLPTEFSGRYCTFVLFPAGDMGRNITQHVSRGAVGPEELVELIAIREGIILNPSIATCLPTSCSTKDMTKIAQEVLISVGISATSVGCFTDEKPPFDAGFWAMIAILAIFFLLNLVGGIVDAIRGEPPKGSKKPGLALQILLAFSLVTNIRKWQNTGGGGGENFGCLHGLRVFSNLWVILGHTWVMCSYVPFWNMADVKRVHETWSMMTVLNGTIAVDTFLVLGGFLVAYNLMKVYDKTKGRLNILMFYLHRYLRLTPTYAILVGIMATILPYLGSGPFWAIIDLWGDYCKRNWWTNILYVNNLVHTDELCQGEGWYLGLDMQLFILSPFVVYPLWKWPTPGVILFTIVTLLSILAPGLQVIFQDYLPTVIGSRDLGMSWRNGYIKPWSHAQPYVVGIWLGYLMFKLRGKKVTMSAPQVVIGWLISTVSALSVLYGAFPWFDPNTEIPDLEGFFYASFNRFAFSMSIAWIIFACVYGYGGYVNRFLSWSPFVPLGRLTFTTYLVSFHLQMIYHLTYRQPAHFSSYSMTSFYFIHVLISFMAGFVCTIMFESPFIQLEKLLLPGNSEPRPQSSPRKSPTDRNGIFYNNMETILKSYKPSGDSNNNADTKDVSV